MSDRLPIPSASPSISKLWRLTFAAVTLTIVALFMVLAIFAYPAADDFCYAAKARELGFFGAQQFWYQHWAGRYTLNLAYTAFSLSGDLFRLYRYPPMMFFIATWLGFTFLLSRLAQGRLSHSALLTIGGIATVLFIAGTPDVAQTFYWPGGSFTYQIPNILTLFLLGLLIWRETTACTQTLWRLIALLAALLTVLIIGANEISLLLTGLLLGGGAFQAFWRRRDSRRFWLGLLLVALAATLVSLLAPGNQERYAGLSQVPQLRLTPLLAILLYLPWVILRILYWLANPGLWASAVVVWLLTWPVARQCLSTVDGAFRKTWLALPALWIAGLFLLNAPGFLVNRYPLPGRAESVVWLWFLLGWYPSFLILAHALAGTGTRVIQAGNRWLQPALALLLISLLGAPNIFEAYKDTYRGYRYDRELRQRFAALQAAKEQGEVDLVAASISHPPATLFAAYLETDPTDMKNLCLRDYYQVRSIRLGGSPPAAR